MNTCPNAPFNLHGAFSVPVNIPSSATEKEDVYFVLHLV